MFPFSSPMVGGVGRTRFTTWDPGQHTAGLTLTNGNLTANASGAGGSNVRTTTSLASGVRVIRFVWALASRGVGIAISSWSAISTAFFLGDGSESVGYQAATGQIRVNGSVLATVATAAVGDLIDVAFDATNKVIWVRVNGGNWNNNGAANPATNTGGISLATFVGSAPYFAAASLNNSGCTVTLQTYGVGLPSGLNMWDE